MAAAVVAAPAHAEFPWLPPPNSGDASRYTTYRTTGPTTTATANDLGDDWKFASTPESAITPAPPPSNKDPFSVLLPLNLAVQNDPHELGGVRGASIADANADASHQIAWNTTTGRPDVVIAVLDSGIEWNDPGAMNDVRKKIHLNTGELPKPQHDRSSSLELEPGKPCSSYTDAYDANGDGVVNVIDWSCDSRVTLGWAGRAGPANVLVPQDLIKAFSDGTDADGNGFVDDIAGWDFFDNDNDPFDDVQYGHGTGEARDSNAEANNGGSLGTCPNCMVEPLRVGESFIADIDHFAEAAIYATDNGVSVIQEALGTLNNSHLARQAIDYAYVHGVTIIASWADEAAQHHNYPAALPHVIVVNSVTQYDSTFTPIPRSYLQLNGCTNFSAKVTVSVPSGSCSSEATGRGAGVAGLIYSAALNAVAAGPTTLTPNPTCTHTDGSACAITPNEVRQLMASGTFTMQGKTQFQADDISWTTGPEQSCSPQPSPTCTDPNLNSTGQQAVVSPLAETKRYPARNGFDEFYGYGRLNAQRAVAAAAAGRIPPEAEITSPEWFSKIDPASKTLNVVGAVNAAHADNGYTCQLYVAPGTQPNNSLTTDSPPGDFKPLSGGYCDGSTSRTGNYFGSLGTVDIADLKSRFPSSAGDFTGRESGTLGQSSNGRPNSEPFGFTVKVVVKATEGGLPTTGEDRRNLFLHRDADLLPGFPIQMPSDGASPPVLADLNGDNRNELIVATSDGLVHAYRPDGSELPGWPVRDDPPALHTGGRAFQTHEVDAAGSPILASVAVGDLHHDGSLEVVAADLDGRVYAWDASGHREWVREAETKFSGKPLTPFQNVRDGKANRTAHAFLGSPVLANLDGNDGGKLEVVIPNMDRHLYAFQDDGHTVPGYPLLVIDRSSPKIASIDPTTDQVRFKPDSWAQDNGNPKVRNQGAIVDTPAVGDIDGDGKPDIVIGTNEEYDGSADGGVNAGNFNAGSVAALAQSGQLALGNSRVYAFHGSGSPLKGWPVKVGQLFLELLPDVGEGITGSPVIADVTCPSGGGGAKVGAISDAGPAYVFNADGTSCLGKDPSNGHDITMSTDTGASPAAHDLPAFPAAGNAIFGSLNGQTALLAPAAGVLRALDLAVNEYQGGEDYVAAWNPNSGQFHPGFPAEVNDLEFITGPTTADIDGLPGDEVIAGTASMDLAAFTGAGAPVSNAWPKLTADWMVATPTIGSFGTLDTSSSAHKDVIAVTRNGQVLAYKTAAQSCTSSSWPRFHHDIANSGDMRRDAIPPGTPTSVRISGIALRFGAPGDDLLCGAAKRYDVFTSDQPISGASARDLQPLSGSPKPADAGTAQSFDLPKVIKKHVAIRAVDDQGNLGPVADVDLTQKQLEEIRKNGTSGSATSGSGNSGRCLHPPLKVARGAIGPVKLGASRKSVSRMHPRTAKHSTLRFCVKPHGQLLAALTAKGRVQLLASTATVKGAHGFTHGLHGRKLTRALHGAKKQKGASGLYRKGTLLIGIRHKRVSFVAIADRRTLRSRKKTIAALKRLGLSR